MEAKFMLAYPTTETYEFYASIEGVILAAHETYPELVQTAFCDAIRTWEQYGRNDEFEVDTRKYGGTKFTVHRVWVTFKS